MRPDRVSVVVVALLLGCSEDPPEWPPPGADSGGGACGAANCPGCCQGNLCINPPTASACGVAGFPCVECGPGETCTTGQCIGSSSCGPSTCGQGCCHNGSCMAGNTDTACGQGGALCTDCAATGGTCQGQVCQGGKPCGPQTCQGCCQGGQCFSGADSNRCGTNGAPCQDCTESSKSCDPQSGTCVVGPPPSCSPTTCGSGCCQGNQCLPGNTNAACGKGGTACVDCTTLGKTCDTGAKTCTGPPPGCSPSSCTGCCKNNQCLPGADDAACGQGGVPCADCAASGKICGAQGACVQQPGCGPGSCPGCCDGTQCLGGSDNWACGTGGVPCQDCSAAGGTCSGGSCSAAGCGPGSCNGCCDGNTCLPGTSKAACGVGGATCKSCGKSFQICSSGFCEIDPSSNWVLKVIRASINQNKVWDSWLIGDSKMPDPYFGIDWDTCSKWSIDSPCTGAESNTFDPEWWYEIGTFTAQEIKGGWCAFVGDADGPGACLPPFESIGLCPIKVYDSELEQGGKTVYSCPHPDDGTNHITYLEFKFIHSP